MTAQELIELAGQNSGIMLTWFVAVPLLTLVLSFSHGRENGKRPPWRYGYSVLVYLSCVPGVLAAVLTAYAILFLHQNLLETNLLVYFAPIVSMLVTIGLIRRAVDLEDVPGFDRLLGLMTLIAVTILVILAIEKTRIWILFVGSFTKLVLLSVGVFVLVKWGAHKLFRRSHETGPQLTSLLNPTKDHGERSAGI